MTFFSLRAISLLATFKMVFSLPHAYSKVPVIKDGYAYVIIAASPGKAAGCSLSYDRCVYSDDVLKILT